MNKADLPKLLLLSGNATLKKNNNKTQSHACCIFSSQQELLKGVASAFAVMCPDWDAWDVRGRASG
jgi:hypothetical protein